MRIFIALVPPVGVTQQLSEIGAGIRRIDPSLRYEQTDKLHFTLEFLGEKPDAWAADCRRALTPALSACEPFSVSIVRIGFFPAHGTPRIIWAGSDPGENARLCSMAADIKRVCAALGHAPDLKPFHPHITLTRVKKPLAPDVTERLGLIAVKPIEFACTEVTIIKSTLAPSGSHYEHLFSIPLGMQQRAPSTDERSP